MKVKKAALSQKKEKTDKSKTGEKLNKTFSAGYSDPGEQTKMSTLQ